MFNHIGGLLFKRAENVDISTPLPPWVWFVIIINCLIFLPLFFIVSYTYQTVFPSLAIIEDDSMSPPASYASINADDDNITDDVPIATDSKSLLSTLANSAVAPDSDVSGRKPVITPGSAPITTSFFGLGRHLRSIGGLRIYANGATCLVLEQILTTILVVFFSSFFQIWPLASLSILFAHAIAVQFSTAWVHIIITPPSSVSLFRRLPPFRSTIRALAAPLALFWFVDQFTLILLAGLSYVMSDSPYHRPTPIPNDLSPSQSCILAAALFLRALALIPAHAILLRCKASLLPGDQQTIVSFDRTFQGRVRAGAFASIADAWSSMSRATWARIIKLWLKVLAFSAAVFVPALLLIVPQVFFIRNRLLQN